VQFIMPYKFIGRATNGYGKTLWEIVGNLKDFGVGRVFARNLFERYPEKSWFRILEVQPLEAPKDVPLYAFDVSLLNYFTYFCMLVANINLH